jgi:hypothetical protein
MNKKYILGLALTALTVDAITVARANRYIAKRINGLTKENRAYKIVNEELVKVLDDPDTTTRVGAREEFEVNCAFRAMTTNW